MAYRDIQTEPMRDPGLMGSQCEKTEEPQDMRELIKWMWDKLQRHETALSDAHDRCRDLERFVGKGCAPQSAKPIPSAPKFLN